MFDMFALFILGLIIGSFLNVLVFRRGSKAITGRSACLSCGALIRWYDNVPVLSYLIVRGRCRSCGSRISVQYILVEILTGALFAAVGVETLSRSVPLTALSLIAVALLVAISVYDLRHTIIPDEWVYVFCGVAIASIFLAPVQQLPLALLAGPFAALPLFVLWLVSRGRWMGFGDVKLALGIGWLLGPLYGIVAVFFAFVIGAVISVAILLPLPSIVGFLRKRGIARFRAGGAAFTMKSEVPFGPFLIASCFILWILLIYQIPLPMV